MRLSYQYALWAAYTVLEILFDEVGYKKLKIFLSEMCPFTFKDRICSDQALWHDWLECARKIDDTGYLSFEQVFSTLVNFLNVNESEYACFEEDDGNFSASEVVKGLNKLVENGRWEKVLDKVANFKGEL